MWHYDTEYKSWKFNIHGNNYFQLQWNEFYNCWKYSDRLGNLQDYYLSNDKYPNDGDFENIKKLAVKKWKNVVLLVSELTMSLEE